MRADLRQPFSLALTVLALAACGGDPAAPAPDNDVAVATEVSVETDARSDGDTPPADVGAQICPPARPFCVAPREAAQCSADGTSIESSTPCVGASACDPVTGTCRPTICEAETTNCLDLHQFQVCALDGSGWGEPQACADPLFCADGKCRACKESAVECLSPTTYRRCAEDASAWSDELLCPSDYRCIEGGAEDGSACKRCGFERVCLSETKVRVRCTSGQIDFQEDTICAAGTTCMDGFCRACEPKQSQCLSETSYRQCADDGSAWSPATPCPADQACFDDRCLPYGCSPRVLLLVDYSGSMSPHWDGVASSVARLVAENPEVRFGLKSFPDDGSSFGCDVTADLEIGFGAGQAEAFADWFASHDPPGATPLAAAIGTINDNVDAIFGPLGGYVIMLSDGEDSCYGSATPSVRQYLALTAANLFAHKVSTYGIAFAFNGAEAGEMDTIAKNGGTGLAEAIDAGNEAELTAAFNAIIDKVKFCEVPPTP